MRMSLQIIISNGILDLVTGILAKISLGTGIWAKFRLGTGIWYPPSRPSVLVDTRNIKCLNLTQLMHVLNPKFQRMRIRMSANTIKD